MSSFPQANLSFSWVPYNSTIHSGHCTSRPYLSGNCLSAPLHSLARSVKKKFIAVSDQRYASKALLAAIPTAGCFCWLRTCLESGVASLIGIKMSPLWASAASTRGLSHHRYATAKAHVPPRPVQDIKTSSASLSPPLLWRKHWNSTAVTSCHQSWVCHITVCPWEGNNNNICTDLVLWSI